MTLAQKYREAEIITPLGNDRLLLTRMVGTEKLGRPFEFQLDLVSEDHAIKASEIIGQNITVQLRLGNGATRFFNGLVNTFTRMPASQRLGCYRASVVPWLWFLTHTSDCRVFQGKTVPEIIKKVFKDHGFTDFEDTLTGTYSIKDYCVQYRETDFNFVSRLMEQEGIYYFFKHLDGRHCLVLTDSPSGHETYPNYEKIRYRPSHDHVSDEEYVFNLAMETRAQPGAFALNEFDFENTLKDLQARAKTSRNCTVADLEIYEYPGNYTESGEGEGYARRSVEEAQAHHEIITAMSNARGLSTGYTFELAEHSQSDRNRQYLVVSTHYDINVGDFSSGSDISEGIYSSSFTAIDSELTYRLQRSTPRPTIPGIQTAIVTGPSGEEIYTDRYGRVKVQFHWDRYGESDENSSCWLRVAQPWAGRKWGAMFIPRIGQEVIVEFAEGNPDRPIVTGQAYNGQAMPPCELPSNKTVSTIRTNSCKGGNGFNEIRFEDKKGQEQVFIHAQKNHVNHVRNDAYQWVGNNCHLIVKNDQFEHIENNHHETVDSDHRAVIGKNRHLTIEGGEAKEIGKDRSLTIKGDVIEVFKKNHSEQTTESYYLKARDAVIEAIASVTLKCGANSIVIDQTGVTITGTMVTIDGDMTRINSGPGSPPASGNAGKPICPETPEPAEECK